MNRWPPAVAVAASAIAIFVCPATDALCVTTGCGVWNVSAFSAARAVRSGGAMIIVPEFAPSVAMSHSRSFTNRGVSRLLNRTGGVWKWKTG